MHELPDRMIDWSIGRLIDWLNEWVNKRANGHISNGMYEGRT